MTRAASAVLVMSLLACRAPTAGPPRVASLSGLEAPLLPGPTVRLAVAGVVDGKPGVVRFDLATPVSSVATGCFATPMIGPGRVSIEPPLGLPLKGMPLAKVEDVRLGGVRLQPFEAALIEDPDCQLVFGAAALEGSVLSVSLARRLLKVLPSSAVPAWKAEAEALGRAVEQLPLTRSPKHDWPLLPVQVRQGDKVVTLSFALATHHAQSRVSEAAADSAGLRTAYELLGTGGAIDEPLVGVSVPYQSVAFAPELEVGPGMLVRQRSEHPLVAGTLAFDVLGHFDVLIDLSAGVLALSSPFRTSEGGRVRCGREASASACYELHKAPGDPLVLTATVWSPLPRGARLSLEVPEAGACRVGFTFSPGGPGRSTQHRFPWAGASKRMPRCAQMLEAARSATLGMLEEEPLEGCPGVCAYVIDGETGYQSCECQPSATGLSPEDEVRLIEQWRAAPAAPAKLPEPVDP